MQTFTIDSENNITVFTTAKEAHRGIFQYLEIMELFPRVNVAADGPPEGNRQLLRLALLQMHPSAA